MENFDQIFTLLAVTDGITLNLDILETGVLNIIALIVILTYVIGSFLTSTLEKRKSDIVTGIQDAEERLSEANRRLSEAQKQLVQTNVLINEIKNETITTKKTLLQSEISQSKKDLTTRFNRALVSLRTKETQVFLEIKQQIILLVLKRIVIRAQQTFQIRRRAVVFINQTINKLEGDL
uniref:ATP synthase subunit b, chloroplastic n=1 Tax=Rhizosolenia imbricata TaxID=216768 RepID=A0A089VJB2_9STRA|nr:ATP synthase CF0 subunit I [Rhizosolenia imbricata]AIR75727.1 ATP synthase CF0 subunit I [Rhizosolenia imbricata]